MEPSAALRDDRRVLTRHDLGASDLVRSAPGELELAWAHRQALLGAAVALTASAGHHPDLGACASAGCALAQVPHDPATCEIAARLARVDGAPRLPTPVLPVDVALAGFTGALVAAADAIMHCRQHEHAGAGCWFAPAPGVDGCGEVLRLLHRCG